MVTQTGVINNVINLMLFLNKWSFILVISILF